MPMVINSNISSLTAQKSLGESQKMQAEAMERLSTGLRINSAKDDAAGMAIAENFTSQIRGLSQAIRNVNDASALAQTAEGGLQETTDILQRMRELAVQASNTTLTDTDRTSIQNEITALTAEIDRIASSTQYNSSNILDGSAKALSFQVGDSAGEQIALSIADSSASGLSLNTSTSTGASGPQISGSAVTAMTTIGVDDISINGFNWSGVSTSGVAHGATVTTLESGVSTSTTLALAAMALGAETNQGARHVALAINSNTEQHGVTATARTEINGVVATGIESNMTVQVAGFSALTVSSSSMQGMVDAINEGAVGVTASLNEFGGLRLVQEEGRSIGLVSGGVGTAGIADGYYAGKITLTSNDGVSPIVISTGSNNNAAFTDLQAMGFNAGSYGADGNPNSYSITGAAVQTGTAITTDTNITINGVELGPTQLDKTALSAVDIVGSVNAVSDETGVTATAETRLELTLAVSAYDTDDYLTFNNIDVKADDSATLAEIIAAGNTAMAGQGSDIVFSSSGKSDTIIVSSASGADITINEVDTDTQNPLTAVVDLIGLGDNDNAGTSAGDIDPGNGHTFSGHVTYTSSTGPIIFGHKEVGTNVLDAAAQSDLDILGVRLNTVDTVSTSSTTVGVDLSSAVNASAAITAIDTALSKVNEIRGDLGAVQNRLEHTVSNLTQTVENHQASRSLITDADFAVESAALAKAQVLAQASTAMLAQANAAPQLALQLLQ